MTLTDFLLARIAEDEEIASNAALMAGDRGFGDERIARGQHWVPSYHKVCRARLEDNPGKHVLLEGRALGLDAAKHVARHDPARVLAECKVKRAIVDEATNQHTSSDQANDIIRMVATIYAAHPDYLEEWKP